MIFLIIMSTPHEKTPSANRQTAFFIFVFQSELSQCSPGIIPRLQQTLRQQQERQTPELGPLLFLLPQQTPSLFLFSSG